MKISSFKDLFFFFFYKEGACTDFSAFGDKTVQLLLTRRDQRVLTSAGLSSWTGGRCHWRPPSPGGSRPLRGCGSHGNPWVCVHTSGWSPQLLEHSDCKYTLRVEGVREILFNVPRISGSERVEFQEPHLFPLLQGYDLNLFNKKRCLKCPPFSLEMFIF